MILFFVVLIAFVGGTIEYLFPKIVVTGGAGFIGSAVIRELIGNTNYRVINVDSLTHAGNLETLLDVVGSRRYKFTQTNICDAEAIYDLLIQHRPIALIHLAAESSVDRSNNEASELIHTNIVGTYTLLEATRKYLANTPNRIANFRFHHVSTYEVFGSLGTEDLFTEESPYQPNSPYSASKASSDHLV